MTTNNQRILKSGTNCQGSYHSDRTSLIVDTSDYFRAFAEACENAQHQIMILGWDFDRHECLFHDDIERELPTRLGAFLTALVKRRKQLRVYLLSWDFNMIYAAEREWLPALRLRLQAPPRFHFRLDGAHPAGASQHQKVVVVDDKIAFCGGIDLSRWRWDTCEHKPDDPRRLDPNGKPYPPFHDMMLLVEGDVARKLGDLARVRWHRARGWKIKPTPENAAVDPWPASISPQLNGAAVAISRTFPAYRHYPAVHEIKQVYLDAIAAAKNYIYIENQYFTALALANAIASRLQERDGPDVVLVLPHHTGGWLEQVTMDVLRGRIVKMIEEADIHRRLRVYYPHQPGLGDRCISVHAKLLVVDDIFLRIGSSNTSNRSLGLDSECDLSIEATDSRTNARDFIRERRQALLAEHLDCDIAAVRYAESRYTRLIETIESLQTDGRSLRALDCSVDAELNEMVPDDMLIDPPEPMSAEFVVHEYIPEDKRAFGRKHIIGFTALILLLLGLAAVWRWTPLSEWIQPQRISDALSTLPSQELQAAVAIIGITLATLLMLPVTLVALGAAIIFTGWQAFFCVLTGATLSAMVGFWIGRVTGKDLLERVGGERIDKVNQRISDRGVIAVAILRMVPVAPFAIFNIIAGASKLGFRQYATGTLIGMTPGLAAITLFSSSLWDAIQSPSWFNIGVLAVIAIAVFFFARASKRWLRSR